MTATPSKPGLPDETPEEQELEPDRNRLHDLVRLTWDAAQDGDGADATPVTDAEIAEAGPYSVEQVREHLDSEQDGIYELSRDGDTVSVARVLQ